jgi:hypothetical protein
MKDQEGNYIAPADLPEYLENQKKKKDLDLDDMDEEEEKIMREIRDRRL